MAFQAAEKKIYLSFGFLGLFNQFCKFAEC